MESSELFRKVRKIEIKTRGLSNQIFSGHYHSVFKGKGMAFSEVREYHRFFAVKRNCHRHDPVTIFFQDRLKTEEILPLADMQSPLPFSL